MALVVIAAGYAGLVAACCLVNSGHEVTCVQVDEAKLKFLKQGSGAATEALPELCLN